MTTTAPPPEAPDEAAEVEVEHLDLSDPKVIEELLAQVTGYTDTIREHQERADLAAAERKTLVRLLREADPPVTFKRVADAMGTTEASVYKLVRKKAGEA